MASINLIADEITGALNRPFDDMFKSRVKSIIRHQLAVFIRQSIEKSGVDDIFKTKFKVQVQKYINVDFELIGVEDERLFRTINKVPRPLRYKTDEPFLWVGDINGRGTYIYSTLQELPYADLQKVYSGKVIAGDTNILYKPIRYVYQNDYIYLFNYLGEVYDENTEPPIGGTPPPDPEIEPNYYIGIEAVYPVKTMLTPEDNLNNETIDDNTDLPIPEDLIQLVKTELLSKELSIIDNRDKEIVSHIDNN